MVDVADRELSVWQGNITTTVRVAGDGPPLVYFHGASGLQWDPFVDSLAESHTVYAPYHPGTDGKHPDDVRSLRTVADLVIMYAELFDELGIDHAVLVGHAFGGMVAAEFAAAYPKFVDKLVLVSPFGLWLDETPVVNWMILDPPSLLKATFADPEGPLAQQSATMMQSLISQPEIAAQYMWTIACTAEFVWPIPDRGLKRRIHRISAPTLVVWGREDGIMPPVYAAEFGSRLRDAKVEVVDGAGHIPQLEQPEVVGKLVREFLL